MPDLRQFAILQVRPAKDSEIAPQTFVHFLASLKSSLKTGFWARLFGRQDTICLEIVSLNQTIFFIVACAKNIEHLVKSQLVANYPDAVITEMADYLPHWLNHGYLSAGQMVLTKPSFLPLKTSSEEDTDYLGSVLGVLSRLPQDQAAIVQLCLYAVNSGWLSYARGLITPKTNADGTVTPAHPQKTLIEQKIAHPGYGVDLRLAAVGSTQVGSAATLTQLASSFGVYSLPEGNSFSLKLPKSQNLSKLKDSILQRTAQYAPNNQVLNYLELATLYHLPNVKLSTTRNIAWGKTIKGEAPEGLPVVTGLSPEDQAKITLYAKTEYKNSLTPFGIRLEDRRRHFYILGKSGTGKSTLIANMAISDMQNNRGLAVVDPHGDLCEILLDYVPTHRLDDIVYLDPTDSNFPFHINPLEVTKPEFKELAVSNILSIFTKIWANVWSARMEYILRNALVTLVEIPGSTMLDIPNLLTDDRFRANLLTKIDPQHNRVILDFWTREYNQYNDKFRNEAIAPILNKVGQFISGPTIRRILQQPKSTINIEDIMNSGKILLLNLSQGKIGEDNAALLGAMFITQFQQSAMNRIVVSEKERRDFFLYVDEFQNFATTSFIKILSEARKYRLGLILANQYTAQLPDEIQKAIFGNVGTMVAFVVGADDANRIMMEFGNLYTQDDLVNLGKYQIINKLSINDRISNPFPAYTLPVDESLKNNNRQQVLSISRQKFQSKEPLADITPIQDQFNRQFTSSQTPPPPRANNYNQPNNSRQFTPRPSNQPNQRSNFQPPPRPQFIPVQPNKPVSPPPSPSVSVKAPSSPPSIQASSVSTIKNKPTDTPTETPLPQQPSAWN